MLRLDSNRLSRRVEWCKLTGKRAKDQKRARWKDKAIGVVRLRVARDKNNKELEEIFWAFFNKFYFKSKHEG